MKEIHFRARLMRHEAAGLIHIHIGSIVNEGEPLRIKYASF